MSERRVFRENTTYAWIAFAVFALLFAGLLVFLLASAWREGHYGEVLRVVGWCALVAGLPVTLCVLRLTAWRDELVLEPGAIIRRPWWGGTTRYDLARYEGSLLPPDGLATQITAVAGRALHRYKQARLWWVVALRSRGSALAVAELELGGYERRDELLEAVRAMIAAAP